MILRLRTFLGLLVLLSLYSCGGGGSVSRDSNPNGSNTGGANVTRDVQLVLTDANGQISDALSELTPLTLTTTAIDSNGDPISSTLVTYTSRPEGLAVFGNASGTASTDVNGMTTIEILVGRDSGAGEIVATLSSGEEAKTTFNSAGSAEKVTTLTLSISDVNVTEQTPATITVVVENNGQVVSGEVVTFTTSLGSFLPESGTALTGEDGVASIVLNGGDISGAGTVTARVSSADPKSIGFTTQAPKSAVLRLGSGTPFVEGDISISLSSISAGGTSVISASLVDEEGNLYSKSAEVEFSSRCSEQVNATASLDSPVVISNGVAESTYHATGCVGDDPITVNVVINDQNLSATGSINVLAADVGSIQFVSATPEHISIQGAGSDERPESAVVIFKVLDTSGIPVRNKDVNFALNSNIGGIKITPDTATTNSEGLVQAVVNSGTVARTIRVVASIDGSDPVIQTQSGELKISTGIPDQDSMSLSVSNFAPRAWDHDGVEVTVTARLADAFNNPPPATAVYFTTEGGSIDNLGASCTTGDDGSCSVVWRSQFPRPEGHVLGDANNPNQVPTLPLANNKGVMGQKYGGRVTILASTIGEESFPDLNGNGRFDVCEVPAFTGGVGKPCLADGSFNTSGKNITYSGNDVSGRPYDIGEAYVDHNEDGVFNQEAGAEPGGELEELVDFNQNGVYDGPDGKYNGILCAIPAHSGCAEKNSLDINAHSVIVMSGDTPYICINSSVDNSSIQDGTTEVVPATDPISFVPSDENRLTEYRATSRQFCENTRDATFNNKQHRNYDDNLFLERKGTGSVSITMADLHNQPMPSGTDVSFETSVGAITSGSSVWSSNANGGRTFSATIKAADETDSGTLNVVITFEDGDTITMPVATIYVR